MMSRRAGILFVTAVTVMLFVERAETHKPVTSKYTYTEDVFPIFNERCGTCHVAGGIAPMSLLSYRDAVPWAEAVRGELISASMPPWFAEIDYGELRYPHRLSPRELDVILTWATGGTPQGPLRSLAAAPIRNWKLGKPDLVFQLAVEFTLAADKMEDAQEFLIQRAATEDRWIRSADLLPGNPAMVRDALIYTKEALKAEPRVLASWLPGEDPVSLSEGAAFRWPAGEDLFVRIHYRKTWKYEGEAMTDRSAVGLYLANGSANREVRSLKVSSSSLAAGENLQVLALRTDHQGEAPKSFRVEAVRPDGSHIPMIALTTRRGWDRRYWFARPISLPKGTRINVMDDPQPHFWLEYVNQD